MTAPTRGEHPYPTDCLPDPLRSAAKAAAQLHGVPEAMAATALLVSLATSAQAEYVVQGLGDEPVPLSLYAVMSARSGVRKSSLGRSVMKPHRDADIELSRRHKAASDNYKAAGKDDKPRKPTAFEPFMVRNDGTNETIPNRMANARMTFTQYLSEAASVIAKWSGSKNQQAGTMQGYAEYWDGYTAVVDRTGDGGRSDFVQDGRFSLLWFGQPDIIHPWLFSSAGSNGFSARVLFCPDNSDPEPARRWPHEDRARLRADLVAFTKVIAHARLVLDREPVEYEGYLPTFKTIQCTNEAEDCLYDFYVKCYEQMKNAPDAHCYSFLPRAAEQAIRIGGNLAAMRQYQTAADATMGGKQSETAAPLQVTLDDITAGIEVVTWHYGAIESVSEVSTSTQVTLDRDELLRLMSEGVSEEESEYVHHTDDGRTEITLRRLATHRSSRFRRDLEALNKAIAELEKDGEVEQAKGPLGKSRWVVLDGAR